MKPGLILFEVGGIRRDAAKEALRLASHKLPIATRMVSRDPLAVEEATEEVKS